MTARLPRVALLVLVVGLALHNLAMALLWQAGVRDTALDVVAAWKETLLLVALVAALAVAGSIPHLLWADRLALVYGVIVVVYWLVPQGVQLAPRGRLAVEPALRHEPVGDDDHAVGEGEPVGPEEVGERARDREGGDEGDEEQRLLPRGDDVQRGVAHAGLPEEGHREVVQRQPDDEDEQRDAREPGGHVLATSVSPRFEIRTGTGKRPRRSAGPSRWFSRAHDLPARS